MPALHCCSCCSSLLLLLLLLQFRKSDKGPPWLLRQVLQPELLQALECPATSQMLHGIYVHLAGSSGNPQDLSMNLGDIRLGLKHAAGFRSLQDLKQQQQQLGPGSGRHGQQQGLASLSSRSHGYQASTQSSRVRSNSQVLPNTGLAPLEIPGNSSSNGSSVLKPYSSSSNASCSSRTFNLPLYKVVAFLRAAKLLPRLFDKYITQQQRVGEEQRVKLSSRGLPVMPSLRANLASGHGRDHGRLPGAGGMRHR
jgi:hypothetical protein